MNIKSKLHSRTLWFNVITLLIAIMTLPQFLQIIPLVTLPYIGLVNSIGNLILRLYFTSQPLTEIAAEQTPPLNQG